MDNQSRLLNQNKATMRELYAPGITCLVSKQVSLENMPILVMIRDQPVDPSDSGWSFLSGEEDEQYLTDQTNYLSFELNTVANFDASLVAFLNAPVHSAFDKDAPGMAWQILQGIFE